MCKPLLLALTVFGLLVLGDGLRLHQLPSPHMPPRSMNWRISSALKEQMIAVNKEQEELQKKTKDIQVRIDAIQKLKASQQGPGAVLREIKARFDGVPGLYLKSIEQKGTELMIKGESPNEASVTRLARAWNFLQACSVI